MRFIPPALPSLRPVPPAGKRWLHELKLDGWRLQLHKTGRDIALFGKNGLNYAPRLPFLTRHLAEIHTVRSAVIDGELVACDDRSLPDFRRSHFREADEGQLCVWVFDLLHYNDKDVRDRPLLERKHILERMILTAKTRKLRVSQTFNDGVTLLRTAAQMGHEGVVSKLRDAPYRSGLRCDWVKVECSTWRNQDYCR